MCFKHVQDLHKYRCWEQHQVASMCLTNGLQHYSYIAIHILPSWYHQHSVCSQHLSASKASNIHCQIHVAIMRVHDTHIWLICNCPKSRFADGGSLWGVICCRHFSPEQVFSANCSIFVAEGPPAGFGCCIDKLRCVKATCCDQSSLRTLHCNSFEHTPCDEQNFYSK